VAEIAAGYNGGGGDVVWPTYFRKITALFKDEEDLWLIDLNNDAADDVWYMRVGFSKDTFK